MQKIYVFTFLQDEDFDSVFEISLPSFAQVHCMHACKCSTSLAVLLHDMQVHASYMQCSLHPNYLLGMRKYFKFALQGTVKSLHNTSRNPLHLFAGPRSRCQWGACGGASPPLVTGPWVWQWGAPSWTSSGCATSSSSLAPASYTTSRRVRGCK